MNPVRCWLGHDWIVRAFFGGYDERCRHCGKRRLVRWRSMGGGRLR